MNTCEALTGFILEALNLSHEITAYKNILPKTRFCRELYIWWHVNHKEAYQQAVLHKYTMKCESSVIINIIMASHERVQLYFSTFTPQMVYVNIVIIWNSQSFRKASGISRSCILKQNSSIFSRQKWHTRKIVHLNKNVRRCMDVAW